MKFCSKPFNHLYIGCDNGNVSPCPWMWPDQCQAGYLWKDGGAGDALEDILHSPKMKELRNSILDGSFRYCRFDACPNMQRNEFEDKTPDEIDQIVNGGIKQFNLAYDFVCNLSCPSCRSEYFKQPPDYSEKMKRIESQLMPYLVNAQEISTSGMGDPFASSYMLGLLERIHPTRQDFHLTLETNGVLFDEKHWQRIKHLGEFYLTVTVTVNSFDESIYNMISRGGNHKKLLSNLEFIRGLRECGAINYLHCAMVIQDRNFREMPSFSKRCLEEYKADDVLLRPIYQWGRFSEEEYWFKDVLNPMHPYHQEYLAVRENPILKDPRVYAFAGDSTHECRPYPGGGTDRIKELETCICDKDNHIRELETCIKNQEAQLLSARKKEESYEQAYILQEQRILELQNRISGELVEANRRIDDLLNSNSWKITRPLRRLKGGRSCGNR